MSGEKTRAGKPKRRRRWVPIPLVPEGERSDWLDRAKAAEWFASGSPGTGAGK